MNAADLDARDPLRDYRSRFHTDDADPVVSYLDGNSLGRPTTASIERVSTFMAQAWGGRLIRGWDEEWFELPITLGDTLGRVALGAAPGRPSSVTPPPSCSTRSRAGRRR